MKKAIVNVSACKLCPECHQAWGHFSCGITAAGIENVDLIDPDCPLSDAELTPMVGVGVFVFDSVGRFLLGKRIGNVGHGQGEFALPGGHMDRYDFATFKGDPDPETACVREVHEETGLVVRILGKCFEPFTNDHFPKENKHYITLFYAAAVVGGELRNMEPDKCEGWEWYRHNGLPSPIYTSTLKILTSPQFPSWADGMAIGVRRITNR